MNTQLNYHHLRYFLAVAGEGGIRKASERLHVSSPTLSAQVRELEGFLGAPLFLRQGKALVLSDTGRVAKRYAERIFSLGDEMLEVVTRGEPGRMESVFVGIMDSVPKLLASQILGRAWEEMPDLRVIVREGLPGELFPALAAHQVDIVIATEPAPASLKTVLFSRKAGRFGVHFVAAPSVKSRYKPRSGLSGFPVLVPTRESALRRELDRWWADAGIQPQIRAECDDSAAMYELAAAGIGAAPLLAPELKDAASRYNLSELPVRTGIAEEIFVVTAERQFEHGGLRTIALLAEDVGGDGTVASRQRKRQASARGKSSSIATDSTALRPAKNASQLSKRSESGKAVPPCRAKKPARRGALQATPCGAPRAT